MANANSSGSLQPPIRPRNGHIIQVLTKSRISTIHQDERSLDDQEALSREFLDRHLDGPYELTPISGQESGERLDSEGYTKAIEEIKRV